MILEPFLDDLLDFVSFVFEYTGLRVGIINTHHPAVLYDLVDLSSLDFYVVVYERFVLRHLLRFAKNLVLVARIMPEMQESYWALAVIQLIC